MGALTDPFEPSQLLAKILTRHLSSEASLLASTTSTVSMLKSHDILDMLLDSEPDATSISKFFSRINGFLQSKDSRVRGCALDVLESVILVDARDQAFREHVASWCNVLAALLNRPADPKVLISTLNIFTRLLCKTKLHPDLQRDVASLHIPKYAATLLILAKTSALTQSVFVTLRKLMDAFPGTLKPFLAQVEALAVADLLSTPNDSDHDPIYAIQCLVSLSHVALTKTGGTGTVLSTKDLMIRAVATGHTVFEKVVHIVEEDERYDLSNVVAFPISDLDETFSTSYQEQVTAAARLVAHLSTLVSCTLSTATTHPTPVPVSTIMSLVLRLYNIGPEHFPSSHTQDDAQTLMLALPQFWRSANVMLKAVLFALGPRAVIYGALLDTIAIKLGDYVKSYRDFRQDYYDILSSLVTVFGPSLVKRLSKHAKGALVRMIIDDLRVNEIKVTVIQNASAGKGKKGKGKGKGKMDNFNAAFPESELSTSLRSHALRLVESMIPFLSSPLRTELDLLLLTSCLSSTSPSSQFHSCLFQSSLHPVSDVTPLIPYAMQVFQVGLSSLDSRVQTVARDALMALDSYYKGVVPPILPEYKKFVDTAKGEDETARKRALDDDEEEGDSYWPRKRVMVEMPEMHVEAVETSVEAHVSNAAVAAVESIEEQAVLARSTRKLFGDSRPVVASQELNVNETAAEGNVEVPAASPLDQDHDQEELDMAPTSSEVLMDVAPTNIVARTLPATVSGNVNSRSESDEDDEDFPMIVVSEDETD